MSISLTKGQKVSLSKETPGLSKVLVGLGWDEIEQKRGFFSSLAGGDAPAMDCDATAIMLKGGKLESIDDVVYYGNLNHKSGSVHHQGDNLTGEGDGDDEEIIINLAQVPGEFDRIVIVVNIYKALDRKQHFGLVENAFCRLVDVSSGNEMCKYDLTEDYSGKTAVIFGEVYRHNGEWKFSAIGEGTKDPGLNELIKRYL